jgi:ArsR family transcriptional regulator, arsenate/arsenite/antimonite-responsive transcriptional repressor
VNMEATAATLDLETGFKALSSAHRRRLLRIVSEHTAAADRSCCATEEVCACRLAEAVDLAPSTISHHMGVLVRAGLVTARKEGLWVYYRIDRPALERLAREIESL